jgi:hypothetical protein
MYWDAGQRQVEYLPLLRTQSGSMLQGEDADDRSDIGRNNAGNARVDLQLSARDSPAGPLP